MKKSGRDFIEHLMDIHYAFKAVLDLKDYDEAAKMMMTYGEENDVNELKMILVITQSFKEHDILGEPRKRLLRIFENKLDKNKK